MNMPDFDAYLTDQDRYQGFPPDASQVIEKPMVGKTYNHDAYGVYEYGTYERGSVLEGQEKRTRLGGPFETLEEAQEAFPDAVWDGLGSKFADREPGPLPPNWVDPLAIGERWEDD